MSASAHDLRLRRCETAALVIAAGVLLLVVKYHLLAALFAGMLEYQLVHMLVPGLHLNRFAGKRAKLVAVALLAAMIVGLLAILTIWSVAFIRGGAENLPLLIRTMAEIIDGSRDWLPAELEHYLPENIEEIKSAAAQWLREHAGDLKIVGRETLRTVAHMLIGMVIGAMLALREVLPVSGDGPPLAAALIERARRFSISFRRIAFAQIRISGLNAFLTWLYLGVALPLLGVPLPYTKTLIAVTFIAGLLPVIGNLISNSVIVVVSLSVSFELALASLAFLVVIHKLEYFLNAQIIGSRIRARAWELLLAILLMEALFGIRGLVAAPVYYAYLKDELTARGLV
jgi:predicted PurR-regulated permease PerM